VRGQAARESKRWYNARKNYNASGVANGAAHALAVAAALLGRNHFLR
jgi:hypothetical protein